MKRLPINEPFDAEEISLAARAFISLSILSLDFKFLAKKCEMIFLTPPVDITPYLGPLPATFQVGEEVEKLG